MEIQADAGMVSMMIAKSQGLSNVALLRKQQEIQVEMLRMADETSRPQPVPRQGSRVDRTA